MNGTLSINGYNSVNVTAKVENGQLIFGKIPKLEGQGEKIYNLIKLANSTEIPTEYIVPGVNVTAKVENGQLIFGKIPKLEGQGEKIYNLIKLANSTEIPTEYIVPGTKVSYSIVDNQTGKVTS